mgnify:CR=1 FL=1
MRLRDRILLHAFGGVAIAGALNILIFGELGAVTGRGFFSFRGPERLFAIWPMAIGAFFIACARMSDDEDSEGDSASQSTVDRTASS